MISIGTGKKLNIQGKVDKLASKHFAVINLHFDFLDAQNFDLTSRIDLLTIALFALMANLNFFTLFHAT